MMTKHHFIFIFATTVWKITNMTTKTNDVTLSDAARQTGRAHYIIYAAYKRGELRAEKRGRDLWVCLADVQALPVRGRGKPRGQVVTDVIPNI